MVFYLRFFYYGKLQTNTEVEKVVIMNLVYPFQSASIIMIMWIFLSVHPASYSSDYFKVNLKPYMISHDHF